MKGPFMNPFEKLKFISSKSPGSSTIGLDDDSINEFLKLDPKLELAISRAYTNFEKHQKELKDLFDISEQEQEQIQIIQKDFLNFYANDTVNPYISLDACGPWIITSCGAVIHDSGGYGMLGFGHSPQNILNSMNNSSHVMANIMTANLQQLIFAKAIKKEIGHSRDEEHKNTFAKFVCLNSGSEAVSLALRLSDINAKIQIEQRNLNKQTKIVSLEQSFHGRTDWPARVSDSCITKYKKHLASFHNMDHLIIVPPNDTVSLENIFKTANKENTFIQAVIFEPVMGEGNPGLGITPEYYKVAQALCKEHKSTLIADSIQAGLRTHGCLSIVDYPGFQKLPAPDCEIYSKALNAGQYPLSVLAVGKDISSLYQSGMYGNTMTGNPRALSVATEVLNSLTPEIRENIRNKGILFLKKSQDLAEKFPEFITDTQGTGLLMSISINPQKAQVVGFQGLETLLRKKGIGVIHGGENALRFTPWFGISEKEVNLIFSKIEDVLHSLS